MTGERRRERDALGGKLDSFYPRYPPDPYTGHLPERMTKAERRPPPAKPRLVTRGARRLGRWISRSRRIYLPLPDEIVEDFLGHGERMIHNDHPSFRAFVVEHVLIVLGLFIVVGVFVVVVLNSSFTAVALTFLALSAVLLWLVLKRLSDRYTSYVVTNVRIMRISGVVTRRVHSIPWMRVTDLTFEQNTWGRLFGFATLHIESANEDSGLRDLAGVSKPMLFNQFLNDMVVAKQGPTAPGWEELGQAGPPGLMLSQRRVGLRERLRQARRQRRELSQAEMARGAETGTRPALGSPAGTEQGEAPPEAAEPLESTDYTDLRRVFVPSDASGPPRQPRRRVDVDQVIDDSSSSGRATRAVDPLREGPESSVPWGRE